VVSDWSSDVWSSDLPVGRGTPELPGLMLALEQGGECEGIAYRLRPRQVRSELSILWNREMLAGIYQPWWVPTILRDGRAVTSVTDRKSVVEGRSVEQ